MRMFDGQVHVAELALLAVVSMLAFLIGTSLPLVAIILMLTWPLLLIQMIFEGSILWLLSKWRGETAPKSPPRIGAARYIWLAPLAAVTLGYGVYVAQTGKWFL